MAHGAAIAYESHAHLTSPIRAQTLYFDAFARSSFELCKALDVVQIALTNIVEFSEFGVIFACGNGRDDALGEHSQARFFVFEGKSLEGGFDELRIDFVVENAHSRVQIHRGQRFASFDRCGDFGIGIALNLGIGRILGLLRLFWVVCPFRRCLLQRLRTIFFRVFRHHSPLVSLPQPHHTHHAHAARMCGMRFGKTTAIKRIISYCR